MLGPRNLCPGLSETLSKTRFCNFSAPVGVHANCWPIWLLPTNRSQAGTMPKRPRDDEDGAVIPTLPTAMAALSFEERLAKRAARFGPSALALDSHITTASSSISETTSLTKAARPRVISASSDVDMRDHDASRQERTVPPLAELASITSANHSPGTGLRWPGHSSVAREPAARGGSTSVEIGKHGAATVWLDMVASVESAAGAASLSHAGSAVAADGKAWQALPPRQRSRRKADGHGAAAGSVGKAAMALE